MLTDQVDGVADWDFPDVYALAVSRKRPIPTRAGVFQASVLAHGLPKRACSDCPPVRKPKAAAFYDWAQVDIDTPTDGPATGGC
ncbi:hypothetical protein ACFQ1I_46705 [Kitasatospora arboriphila]